MEHAGATSRLERLLLRLIVYRERHCCDFAILLINRDDCGCTVAESHAVFVAPSAVCVPLDDLELPRHPGAGGFDQLPVRFRNVPPVQSGVFERGADEPLHELFTNRFVAIATRLRARYKRHGEEEREKEVRHLRPPELAAYEEPDT